ncbi:MAG: branched-chain amino acid ABC transporter permease [Acidimicrobiales bacterium]
MGLALVAAFVVWWLVTPEWLGFYTTVALAKGLVVLGVVLLLRTGLVSFGQGLFFAGGAYAAGFAIDLWGLRDAFALIAIGTVAGGALALLTGLLVARYREIFFAMLTLAFSMTLYGILLKSFAVTGGSQGMRVAPPTFLGLDLPPRDALYLLSLACAAGMGVLTYRYAQAPLGHVARAIRDNEIRVGYLGASVQRAVLATFVLAGAAAGLGGALEALTVGHIDPNLSYWTTSGEFVFVAILSGTGSVLAPLIGSVIFEILRAYALAWFPELWQLVLGIVLLLVVLFLPGGFWSLSERLRRPSRLAPREVEA